MTTPTDRQPLATMDDIYRAIDEHAPMLKAAPVIEHAPYDGVRVLLIPIPNRTLRDLPPVAEIVALVKEHDPAASRVEMFDSAVIADEQGYIVYNLVQQDMSALRLVYEE